MDAEGVVYVIMGPPEAGKTTQAKRLSAHLEGVWVWDEDMLAAVGRPEAVWDAVQTVMSRLPPESPVILDGLVRNAADVGELTLMLGQIGRRLERVICLQIFETESLARARARVKELNIKPALRVRWREYRLSTIPAIEVFRTMGVLSDVAGEGNPATVELLVVDALQGPPSEI